MLLFVLLSVALVAEMEAMATYQLADIMYQVPTCEVGSGGTVVQNSFGQLLLENSLLGSRLRLTVMPDPNQTSCRFCDRLGFCTQPFGNASNLHLAYDTRYNIRVISLDRPDSAPISIALPQPSATTPEDDGIDVPPSVSLSGAQLGAPQLCGQRLRMVVILFMTAERPALRDFMVTAWDPATWETTPCSTIYTALTCQTAPAYYVLDYTVANCVDSVVSPALSPPPPAPPSFVNYYYEAVAMRAEDALPPLRLCGESWLSLYSRCRLEAYCDADQALFIALKPWYQSALYATAAWCSGRRDAAVWQALQELEQYCEARDLVLDLFVNMSAQLAPNDTDALRSDWAVLCEWAAVNNATAAVHDNITLPFYFYHHQDWYFAAFRHVVYYNDDKMPLKSALLVAFASLAACTVIAALAYTVWYVWRSIRLRRDSHEYLLV